MVVLMMIEEERRRPRSSPPPVTDEDIAEQVSLSRRWEEPRKPWGLRLDAAEPRLRCVDGLVICDM